jgi:hypothetical protein
MSFHGDAALINRIRRDGKPASSAGTAGNFAITITWALEPNVIAIALIDMNGERS